MSSTKSRREDLEAYMSENGSSPAVLWDYDRVLSDGPAYRLLVEGWHDAGHLDEDTYTEFVEADKSDYRSDHEFQGDLLYRVTDGLSGENKGELFATTADLIVEHRDRFLSEDADTLLYRLARDGFENHIISHNYRILFDALADHSAINENNVYANRLAVGEDGRLTGGLASNTFQQGKREIVADIANQQYIRAGVGDSLADLPILTAAEDGFAINPTEELREEAGDDDHLQITEGLDEIGERLLG